MIWIALVIIVGVIVVAFGLLWYGRPAPRSEADARTMIELHRVCRRFDVAQVKHEIRRDAADTRRSLNADLRPLDDDAS